MIDNIENRKVAIRLSGIKKMYKLGQIGGGTLQGDLQSWWARIHGREDPNTKIGQVQRLVGQTFLALNGIDLTVYRGEALGIIGPNGAGKSTMLKLISRITAPTEGEIDLYGRVASMLEVGTGFNGEMTGRENIYMNGAILGMTKAEIDDKMEKIIDFSEVREFIDTPVKRYSSGMYVKLAFSVAAHLDSEIMIMDEVLAVGDVAFQKKCIDKMREAANKEGRTVLYVSHNMNTIRQLCDRCVVLNSGKIIFDGPTEEAISNYLKSTKALSLKNTFEGKHLSQSTDGSISLNGVVIQNKDYPSYYSAEKVKLLLNFTSKADLYDLGIRMLVSNEEGGVVGLASTETSIHATVGENSILLSFDPHFLAPGKYFIKLTVFSLSENGRMNLHDMVYDAFGIEKLLEERENNGLKWDSRGYGYVMFPQIAIE